MTKTELSYPVALFIVSVLAFGGMTSFALADHSSGGATLSDHSHDIETTSHVTTVSVKPATGDTLKITQMKTLLASLVELADLLKHQQEHAAADAHHHDEDSHHEEDDHHADGHSHTALYEATKPVPEVTLELHESSKGGYAVHADTKNFTFAPLHADGEAVDGEGHAHIYVDGVKISRMYAPWFYLEAPKAGKHVITVELSTNDHQTYAHDGEKIEDSVTITVK